MTRKKIKNFSLFFLLSISLVLPSSLSSQVWWEDSGRRLDYDLSTFKILVLLGDDFDYHELMVIKSYWEKWKAKVIIAGSEKILNGHLWSLTAKGWEKTEHRKVHPDILLSGVKIENYQAIFLPGGGSPKNLIEKSGALVKRIIQEADKRGILLSAICHGPYVLAESDVIRDTKVTGHPEIIKNLTGSGGKHVSAVTVVDQNIITGNWPYFESFALNVAEELFYPEEKKKSILAELESHPALKVIKERRSIRRFLDKDIEPSLIEELLYMASWAPSSNNDQPWRFVVVKDEEKKSRIFDIFMDRMKEYYEKRGVPLERIKTFWSGHFTAPVFVFAFNHPPQKEEPESEFSDIEKIWNIQSVSNACQNLLLAAKAMNLGTCWMGALLVVESEIKQILNTPEEAQLMTVIALGYPAQDPLPRVRKPLSETVFYEKWGIRRMDEQTSQQSGLVGHPQVHKITQDVYAITSLFHSRGKKAGVNAGIIFTEKSIIFIDSGMNIASAEFIWKTAAERAGRTENLYLILTHHHSDHVFGMRVFKEKGATVIAHKGVEEELKDDNGFYKKFVIELDKLSPEEGDRIYGDVLLTAPDQLIENDTVLNIDGDEIHLLLTPGHVEDEIVVYHPKSRTLFGGDTIYEGMPPNTRFGGQKEWRLWISHLERLKKLEIDVVVPGHGNLSSKEILDHNIAYLKSLF
jgi:F420 biosynthesis protein FbiB-like protein